MREIIVSPDRSGCPGDVLHRYGINSQAPLARDRNFSILFSAAQPILEATMGTTNQRRSVMAGLPEGYLPRKGDVLVLHVEVKYDVEEGDTEVHAVVPGQEWNTAIVPLDKVDGIARRRWRAGERVLNGHLLGTVIAQSGTFVWVDYGDGRPPGTSHSDDLKAAPTPVEEPPEVPRPQAAIPVRYDI